MGGAIFSGVLSKCTFEFSVNSTSNMKFSENYAQFFEQSVYIENIGTCGLINKKLLDNYQYSLAKTDFLFPLYKINFNLKVNRDRIMLGKIFNLKSFNNTDIFGREAVGIGYIRVRRNTNKTSLQEDYRIHGPQTINLDNYTESIKFYMYGPKVYEDIDVTVEIYFKRHAPYGLGLFVLNFSLVPCKMGYKYSVKDKICVCADQTNKYIQCHLQSISIKRHYWYSCQLKEVLPCPQLNCIFVSEHCTNHTSDTSSTSSDYCSIQSPADVCKHGRSGFLCYNCADNYSFTLGALKCTSRECDVWSALEVSGLLLAYWILSISAILIIAHSQREVSLGFMFGIMHYYSGAMLYTKSSELFSEEWMQIVIYMATAITSINPEILGLLDICFAENWSSNLLHELFRFLSPVLVGMVVLLITFLLRRFRKARHTAPTAEKSTIRAVCLLILFSYTSITNTSLKLLIPMKVNGSFVAQVAPTIPYFHKDNIPYVIIGICAEVLFSLPLCFLLLLLSPVVNRCVRSNNNRFRQIINDFCACYRPGCQWFAGFYFLSRQAVFVLNATNTGPFPNSNTILTIAIITI